MQQSHVALCPVVFHRAGHLTHAPAKEPIEQEHELDVGLGIFCHPSGHALDVGVRIVELGGQIPFGEVGRDHAALAQDLVVG